MKKCAKPLHPSFYTRSDVVQIARELLGKVLVSQIDEVQTAGIITETEAYAGIEDKASHAFGGRFTDRTSIMYEQGGVAYIYLCYGIHSLFNVVTAQKGIPHAALIRAIRPLEGVETMLKRSGKKQLDTKAGNGPGKVTRLLGITTLHNGFSLLDMDFCEPGEPKIFIEDRGITIDYSKIVATPRIGIGYAGEDALLPYRFYITPNAIK
jgi:DNA-3-methyladenine glycosylase